MNDRMNQPDPPAPDREELRDRLLDAALRERLGGATPPDLSAAILARAATDAAITPSTREEVMPTASPKQKRYDWSGYGIAAAVLIGAGLLLLPSVKPNHETARRASSPSTAPPPAETKPAERLVMGVTPKIIVSSEDESDQLGIVNEELAAKPANPAAAVPGYTVDLGKPFRQGSFSLATPQFTGKNPEGESQQGAGQQAGATNEQKYPNVRESSLAAEEKEVRLEQLQPQLPNYGYYSREIKRFPSSPASTPGDSTLQESIGGRVYEGKAPLRLWANTGDENLYAETAGQNAQAISPLGWHGSKDAQIAKLKQELTEMQTALQSKLSTSRSPNAADVRANVLRVQLLEKQIRTLEGLKNNDTSRDQYARIIENPFLPVSAANTDNRLSTFSIDVDTASYANVRQFLMQSHTLPPPDAVRIEELVNYFDYNYTPPTGDVPFAANVEVAGCPWAPDHRLVRVGIKGREIERTGRPLSNLVFLIDVSGSMNEPNKLPLLVAGMKQLTRQLGENDRVAIVVYASSEGLALDSTPGTDQSKILAALDQLQAGGSTAGGAGIQLAYQVAQQNFIKGAVNRVILCTDGDFNVGVTSPADLERMAEANAKETGVFLTVLGFGRGNLNDAMMEQVADKGNGNYHYIDTDREAQKVLVEEMTGTLVTIAKDVKIQVEFNPAKVAGYRLIGYENRVLAAEDFNDDKKDAGEIGAGHTVTALYEIVPVGMPVAATAVDELKYASKPSEEIKPAGEGDATDEVAAADEPASDELLTLKIRYKAPDGDQSTKLEFPIVDNGQTFAAASQDFKFASAVASFGMLLRNSEFKGNATYAAVEEIAAASQGNDPREYRQEFVDMVERAKQLTSE